MKEHNSGKLVYKDLIEKMTLEEKVSLMSGANFWNTKAIERLNIPSMMLTDGPHGLRKQGGKADHLGLNKSLPATCFPTAATLANSWDIELIKEVGKSLGKEASSENVNVLLGPGLNIKRNPLCGRNFEYFSEDPYLTGKLSASMIKGIQEEGISACPKHYAVNSQETHRMSVDEIVDKRALHEMYIEGFRYAICEGQAKTIMTSYNKVNGVYANENKELLQDILTNEWEFKGLIVTDWGGNNDRVEALKAGNQLEMPSTNGVTDKDILKAIKNGDLDENILNSRVDSLLNIIFDTQKALQKDKSFTYDEHHQLAIEASAKSIILLKNENILPLKNKEEKISIIGDFAKNSRYQGAGSSLINPIKVDNFLEEFKNEGYNIIGYEQGFKRLGGKSEKLKNSSIQLAKNSDKVILYLGLDEGSEAEGIDRKSLSLTKNQLELFNVLYEVNQNIVVILAGGSPIEMPFIENAKAVVHGYLSGQGGGKALTKIISGEVNPSGKLAESYPIKYEDVPSSNFYPGKETISEHRESIYFGYRYYDKANKELLFPFGYGLSYTTFEYSNLSITDNSVSFFIKNTGKIKGEEIAQVYISAKESNVFRANKELKGFVKVELEPEESKEVKVTLDDHAFSYFNIEKNRWVTENCKYEVLVGASSRDIKLKEEINIKGEEVKSPYSIERLKKYYDGDIKNLTKDDFEKLIGKSLPNDKWEINRELGYNDIIEQAKNAGFFGKLLYKVINWTKRFLRKIGKPITANNVMFVMELPFRSIARMSAGKVNEEMLDGILMMVNGHFFKGFTHYIKAYFKYIKYKKSLNK